MDCRRGEAEDRIKGRQRDLFADRTSCHRPLAHRFRRLLSSAAYRLVQGSRRTAPAGTELAAAQVGTIRLRLLKVAARAVTSARRVVSHRTGSYPYRDLFRRVRERAMAGLTASGAGWASRGCGEGRPPGVGARGGTG